jgi:hypothetical protein
MMHLHHRRKAVVAARIFSCRMRRMLMVDAYALNRLILRLYREGREVPLGSYQAWALEQLQSLLTFDSAWWGNVAADPPALHDVFLHNCDESLLQRIRGLAGAGFLSCGPGRFARCRGQPERPDDARTLRAHGAVSPIGAALQGGVVVGNAADGTLPRRYPNSSRSGVTTASALFPSPSGRSRNC